MLHRVRDMWAALAIVTIAACAQFNPVAQADTTQQKALAAYGTVTIMVEQIAALVEPGTLPAPIQARLIDAGLKGGTVAKEGMKIYLEADAARVAFEASAAQQGKLVTTVDSLESWIDRASLVIDDMKTVLRGAQ